MVQGMQSVAIGSRYAKCSYWSKAGKGCLLVFDGKTTALKRNTKCSALKPVQ